MVHKNIFQDPQFLKRFLQLKIQFHKKLVLKNEPESKDNKISLNEINLKIRDNLERLAEIAFQEDEDRSFSMPPSQFHLTKFKNDISDVATKQVTMEIQQEIQHIKMQQAFHFTEQSNQEQDPNHLDYPPYKKPTGGPVYLKNYPSSAAGSVCGYSMGNSENTHSAQQPLEDFYTSQNPNKLQQLLCAIPGVGQSKKSTIPTEGKLFHSAGSRVQIKKLSNYQKPNNEATKHKNSSNPVQFFIKQFTKNNTPTPPSIIEFEEDGDSFSSNMTETEPIFRIFDNLISELPDTDNDQELTKAFVDLIQSESETQTKIAYLVANRKIDPIYTMFEQYLKRKQHSNPQIPKNITVVINKKLNKNPPAASESVNSSVNSGVADTKRYVNNRVTL